MRSSFGKHLGRISEVESCQRIPVPTVDEDENRSLCSIGTEDIELFDFRWSIVDLSQRSEAGANRLTIGGKTRVSLTDKRFIVGLIVGSIEFELIVVQKNRRTFMVFRRSKAAFLYNPRGRGYRRRGTGH